MLRFTEKITIFCTFLFTFCLQSANATIDRNSPATSVQASAQHQGQIDKIIQPFVENRGQLDPRVAYYLNTGNGRIFLTKDGEMVFSFREKKQDRIAKNGETTPGSLTQIVFKLVPEPPAKSIDSVTVYGEKKAPTRVNYFIGPRENWKGAITMGMLLASILQEGVPPICNTPHLLEELGLNSAVSKAIAGLIPNTTYHYRVVGVNSQDTTNGSDQNFSNRPNGHNKCGKSYWVWERHPQHHLSLPCERNKCC